MKKTLIEILSQVFQLYFVVPKHGFNQNIFHSLLLPQCLQYLLILKSSSNQAPFLYLYNYPRFATSRKNQSWNCHFTWDPLIASICKKWKHFLKQSNVDRKLISISWCFLNEKVFHSYQRVVRNKKYFSWRRWVQGQLDCLTISKELVQFITQIANHATNRTFITNMARDKSDYAKEQYWSELLDSKPQLTTWSSK